MIRADLLWLRYDQDTICCCNLLRRYDKACGRGDETASAVKVDVWTIKQHKLYRGTFTPSKGLGEQNKIAGQQEHPMLRYSLANKKEKFLMHHTPSYFLCLLRSILIIFVDFSHIWAKSLFFNSHACQFCGYMDRKSTLASEEPECTSSRHRLLGICHSDQL